MKKRFSEEKIVSVLQEVTNGKSVREVAREHGISENTYYVWKKKYGDMNVSEVVRMRELEDENAKLKKLVAELSLDNMIQKDVIKNFCRPK